MRKWPVLHDVYVHERFFALWGGACVLLVLSYLFDALLPVGQMLLLLLALLTVADAYLLWGTGGKIACGRKVGEKLSNGDFNPVQIDVASDYRIPLALRVLEEAPPQFQRHDLRFAAQLRAGGKASFSYRLRPVERGEYSFGVVNVYVWTALGLLRRRFEGGKAADVKVYPSFLQMRRYELMAISNRLSEAGLKKIRRLGHTTEFEQIKEYTAGDDYRTLNWKATARANKLMVNQYADERSQHIYCLIDKSRAMKMPFEGMSLLDYAINASLVISNIALLKKDKAGLVAFAEQIDTVLPPSSAPTQMQLILESLYKQETRFLEADYARLFTLVKNRIFQRSLLLLFTNFESQSALRRQLPYLQRLAKLHLLVVVFFENTELQTLISSFPQNTEEMYVKAIGESFALEKKLIARELEQHGIFPLLTPPQSLTAATLNKYLELKARGMI